MKDLSERARADIGDSVRYRLTAAGSATLGSSVSKWNHGTVEEIGGATNGGCRAKAPTGEVVLGCTHHNGTHHLAAGLPDATGATPVYFAWPIGDGAAAKVSDEAAYQKGRAMAEEFWDQARGESRVVMGAMDNGVLLTTRVPRADYPAACAAAAGPVEMAIGPIGGLYTDGSVHIPTSTLRELRDALNALDLDGAL
jgi:hypothetical protein